MEKFKEVLDELNAMELKDLDLYVQYHKIKSMMSVLDERAKELSSIIVEDMQSKQEQKKVYEFGSFTIAKRKSYEYTDAVKSLEEKVKDRKEIEIKEGLATVKETSYLLLK